MPEPIRVMLEHGKKKRVVACAFDWPGWRYDQKLWITHLLKGAAYLPV